MARTAKQELSYQKSRIRKQIKRMQKRGYVFENGDPFPVLKNKTARGQAAELKRFTTQELYKKATFETPSGEYLTGTEGRKFERKEAAFKAKLTRSVNKYVKEFGTIPQAIKSETEIYKQRDIREDFHAEHGTITTKTPASESEEILENLADEIYFEDDKQEEEYLRMLFDMYMKVVDFDPEENWVSWYTGMIKLKQKQKDKILSIFDAVLTSKGKEQVARNIEKEAEFVRSLLDRMLYSSYTGASGMSQARQDLATLTTILKGEALTPDEVRKITRGVA